MQLGEATAREIMNYYAKRWTIEPGFRDTKDLRFGMGLSVLRIAGSSHNKSIAVMIPSRPKGALYQGTPA
jgi:hypothetical protein